MRTRDDEDDHNDRDDGGDGDDGGNVPHASRYANFIVEHRARRCAIIDDSFPVVANLMRVSENSVQGFRHKPTCRGKSITTRFGKDGLDRVWRAISRWSVPVNTNDDGMSRLGPIML